MLNIGDAAPDFAFADTTLAQVLKQGPAIVYFFPAVFTPVCTKEACVFRDGYEALAAAGITVIGISPQAGTMQEKFRVAHHLPFAFVSDVGLKIARSYGAVGMLGLPIPFGVRRVTYLVSSDGRVVDRAVGELGVGEHQKLMERAVKSS